MTESRPPAASRHADARSPAGSAANPLQRPLPPGLGRRPGTQHAAASPAVPTSARSASPAARASSDAAAAPLRARSRAESSRPPAHGSAIPLMAPPAWQVAGVQAEERQLEAERAGVGEERGLPSWAGLLVLLAITGVGGFIDAVAGAGIKGTFSIGLVVGSLAAILLVRRSAMFPIVVAPPLVYFLASAVLLYVRSDGLSSKSAIYDAAASWLVYGFPAIAGATALVLIAAGIRMILHR